MRKIELLLALFGTAICLGGVYWAWGVLPSPPYIAHDAILPYLYLMEMAVAAALGLAGVVADAPNRSLRYGWVPWCVAGVILAFAALGALSIGLLFLPTGIAFLGAGILAVRRRNRSLFRHLGVFVLATLLQAGLMVGIILLISPNAQWG